VTTNAKGEESKSELVHLSYPGEALAEFEAVFAKRDASGEKARMDGEKR